MTRVNNIVDLINENEWDNIVLTQDTHYEDHPFIPNYLDTLEGKNLPIKHCIFDTEGWKINRKIAEAVYEKRKTGCRIYNIQKSTFGAYPDLIETLEMLNDYSPIDEFTFCGFDTDICVIANILLTQSAFPEVPINLVEKCCAGSTPENHKAALQVLESCQINVIKENNK